MKWHIVPEARDEMIRTAYKGGRGGHRGSSAPSSPNQINYAKDMVGREQSSARKRKASPGVSPPLSSAARASQSTPDRTQMRGTKSRLAVDDSPLPRPKRHPPGNVPTFSGLGPQSPTLTSSYLQEDSTSFVTPAPHRVHPKLAPPSTAQRPSQHMPTSSPAPFWKYADIGSTPLKPTAHFDLSPTAKHATSMVNSSSPPHADAKSPIAMSPLRPQASVRQENQAAEEPEEDAGFDLTK
jgi:forkhead protein FKH